MNRIFRLVWSDAQQRPVVTSELASSHGKSNHRTGAGAIGHIAAATAGALLSAAAIAAPPAADQLPTQGQVVAGQATINQQGANMNIAQQSDKAIINWQSFDVGSQAQVNFNQPTALSVALNRVNAGSASQILGQINANGQVFLVNPNGIVFGQGSQVNVGGLVASTLDITNENFLNGKYEFNRGNAKGSILNQGEINANNGLVALLAPQTINDGIITAQMGSAILASGDKATLSAGADGLIQIALEKSTIDSLVENKQLIQADGGQVIMTASAMNAAAGGIVKNSGTVKAQTLQNKDGRILLIGDMDVGKADIAGTLDASAPITGNGGFIETSAATVNVADGTVVTTKAEQGETGTWLIDPGDYIIAASGGNITGAQLGSNLASNHIKIENYAPGEHIYVNDNVTWSSFYMLTLHSKGNIEINSIIDAGSHGKVVLEYGQATGNGGSASYSFGLTANGFSGKIKLSEGYNFYTKKGSSGDLVQYQVITSLGAQNSATGTDLQGIKANLYDNYVLGADIDASATSGWNSGAGFTPIGALGSSFTGTFDGLGHTISNLTINRSSENNIGLFGYTSSSAKISNIGLVNASIKGGMYVGSLVGNNSSTILNSFATGSVTGQTLIGGLVGNNSSSISNSYVTAAVDGLSTLGGLVGSNSKTISNSYATGTVSGNGSAFGGLVGKNSNSDAKITNSYATGNVMGSQNNTFGGLVGENSYGAQITNSYATGNVSGGSKVGGLVGSNNNDNAKVTNSYATGSVTGNSSVGGLVGINTGATVTNSYWDKNTTGQTTSSGSTASFGKTTAEMMQASTFASWSIDSQGGQNKIWRIYDGYTAPLLSGLLTNITVTANPIASKVYDGTTAVTTGTGVTYSIADAVLNGTVTYTSASKNAGTQAVKLGGLYSDQQGYNINYAAASIVIDKKLLTIGDLTADNKEYDGTTNATLTVTSLNGAIDGDSIGAVAQGTFANKNVGVLKTVSVDTVSLTGDDAGNYILNSSPLLPKVANITAKALDITGLSAASKTYDGTTATTLTGTAVLSGIVGSEQVEISGTASGAFIDKNAGNAKAVTVSGVTLTGDDAGNYTIKAQPTGLTADINAKELNITGMTADNKTYDGNAVAVLNGGSLVGIIDSEDVSYNGATGAFDNKNAGENKAVTVTGATLSGADASNYILTQPTGLTADIAKKAITIEGITAADKTYDATDAATVDVTGATGWINGDSFTVSATGVFSDKNAADGKTVNLTSNYTGADVANYTITDQATTTASIARKAITVTGITAENKTYDATDVATTDVTNAAGWITGDAVTVTATGVFSDKNAADGKTVTLTSNYSGNDVANYDIADQATATANIDKKAITVTGITAADKEYNADVDAVVNASNATGWISGDSFTVSATGVFSDKNAAEGKTVTLTSNYAGADVANYAITDQATTTADINTKELYITGLNAANKTYDGTTAAELTGTAALSGIIGSEQVATSGTALGAFSDKNVGNAKVVTVSGITLTGTDAGNYTIKAQSTGLTADIAKKAITIEGITAADKTYNATDVATVDVAGATGWISGDDFTVSATGVFSDKNAADGKTVNLTSNYTGNDVANYVITDQATTSADINKKAIIVTGITAADKEYNADVDAVVNASSATGWIAGDAVTVTATGVFSDKNAADGKTVNLTSNYTGADVANYTITDQTTATANIAKKAITVTGITAADKEYNADVDAVVNASSATGWISGDSFTVSATGVFSDKNAADGKTVTLTSNYTGNDVANYTITDQATATANIDKKAITVTGISAENKTYDATDAATVDVTGATGWINGDDFAVTTIGVFSDKNAADSKTVNLTSNYTGNDVANYTVTDQATTTASIAKKAIIVTGITAENKTYDATTIADVDVAGAAGWISGDDVVVTTTGAFSDKNAADGKTVNLTSNYTGNDLANYTITDQATATANIDKLAINISGITAENKTYDATDAATTDVTSAAGWITGDAVTVTTTGVFSDKNAADGKTVTLTSSYGGADAGNYTITDQTTATADIDKLAINISGITAANKTYDATDAATVDVTGATGWINGDDFAVTTIGVFSDKNAADSKTVNLTSNYTGNDVANYTVTDQATTTASIAKKAIIVTGITAENKTYDATTIADVDVAGAAGWISGDDVVVTTTGAFSDKNAANGKTVNLTSNYTGADVANYTITDQATTTASIAKKAITVTGITAENKSYDATNVATTDVTNAAGWITGDAFTVTTTGVFSDKNAADGKTVSLTSNYTGADVANYTITDQATATANIDKKAITVTGITAENKTYDATDAATVSVTNAAGWINGDDFTVSATGVFSDKNAANGKTVNLTSNYTGNDVANYTITDQATTSADILKAKATVTANSGVFEFNESEQSITGFTIEGFVNGESADVLVGIERTGGVGVAAGKYAHNYNAGSYDGNYDLVFNAGELTITEKAVPGSRLESITQSIVSSIASLFVPEAVADISSDVATTEQGGEIVFSAEPERQEAQIIEVQEQPLEELVEVDNSSSVEIQPEPEPEIVLEPDQELAIDVSFALGSTSLQMESLHELKPLVDYLNAHPDAKISIEGHTDSRGSAATNKRISQQRADAVKAALVAEYGIDADRIEAVGRGSEQAIADNSTEAGRAQNRRISAKLITN